MTLAEVMSAADEASTLKARYWRDDMLVTTDDVKAERAKVRAAILAYGRAQRVRCAVVADLEWVKDPLISSAAAIRALPDEDEA